MNASSSSHADSPAAPRAVSADSSDSLVQLPFDFPKIAAAPRTWACARPRVLLELTPPLSARQRATLVAALLALLHRYAQQTELKLDLAVHIASLAEATCGQVDFVLDDQQTLASVVALAAVGLETLPSVSESREQGRSNVALTLLRGAADLDASGLARAHDLHFVIHEDEQRVALRVAYDGNLFRAQTVERLVEAYARFLHEGWLGAESSLSALPVLSAGEVSEILLASEGRCSSEPEQTFLERFVRLARAQPGARAVSYRDQHLTYGELDARAEQLANYLVAAGIRLETRVAVCLTPSLEVVIALLAIFKTSAVYVPLDPTHPAALLSTILEEVSPRLVLTDSKVGAAALPDTFARLVLDRDWSAVEAAPVRRCRSRAQLDAACYVLYTSGTTGRPKGVLATQRNLGHYLRAARERYEFTSDDVFCSLARYTFSISFFELLSPLACGGRLLLLDRDDVLDPARLVAVLAQVTVLHAGPSLLGSLFRHLAANSSLPRTFANVRHASSGGDLVGPQVLEEMKQVFCDAEIFVIYGCTEIACMGMTLSVSRAHAATTHVVGRPFADVSMRVLDAHGRLVPFGVVGEIHFAGKGIARRYLERPALTSEKFVCIDGQRFYKTGDLGRLHADGNLEILGRRDFQVQLRGIRIELAGIEQLIRELGLAAQAAVIAAARDAYDMRLVAFVVSPRSADTASFRKALALQLPDYMVPQAVIELEAFPLTANGKLDRMRLRELAFSAPRSDVVRGAPETVAERTIAEAFASVLGVSEVGAEDDFFDLGGHSLTAVLLLSRLQDELGLSLSPALLFEHTTVRGLARALDSVRNDEEGSEHLPILLSQSADHPALFMLLGVHLYRELSRELAGRFSVYGVYAGSELGLLESVEHAPSVSELAREYVALIRRVQPTGPYRIGGMSFGGIVAYEAAQQLEDEGEEVASLLLLDAVLPDTMLTKLRRMMELPGRALVSELSQRMHARLAGLGVSSAANDFNKYQDDPLLRPLEDRRQDAYRKAAIGYMRQIRPFHGDATLVVAGKRLDRDRLQDPACGFSARVSRLRVHSVEAEHLQLLEQPRVAEVAQLVLEDLRRSCARSCVPPRAPTVAIAASPLELV